MNTKESCEYVIREAKFAQNIVEDLQRLDIDVLHCFATGELAEIWSRFERVKELA